MSGLFGTRSFLNELRMACQAGILLGAAILSALATLGIVLLLAEFLLVILKGFLLVLR